MSNKSEKSDMEKGPTQTVVVTTAASIASRDENAKWGSTSAEHRRLESFHVNLIAMGGSIGTATFVYIGSGLTAGGPLGLLLGYSWWTAVIYTIAMAQMEIVTFWPTDTAFARNASRYIDEAWGFGIGWNFWVNEIAVTAYEVTAFTIVLEYWARASDVNPGVYIAVVLASYFVINIWDTRFFGHAEFGFSMSKILLSIGLLFFTFIVMLGANPIGDKFGFRYWKNPGVFANPYPAHGKLTSQFEGFLAATTNAAFTIVGPEYLTMIAGETKNPRVVLPKAFKKTVYRLVIFFIGGALCVGVLVPYNSPELLGAISSGAKGAAKSPYVIAMNRLQIKALPSIINACIAMSIYSAGNAYYYCSSRSLAQMARDGHAPKIFGKRNRYGVPWVAVLATAFFSLISFCQVASSAQIALTWLTSIVTANGLVSWITFSFTHIRWSKALKVQGVPRSSLPVTSWLMPWGAYFSLGASIFVILLQGYTVFLKGSWSTDAFLYSYLSPMVIVFISLCWKVLKKTTWKRSADVDLVSFIDDPAFDVQPEDGKESSTTRWLNRLF